MKCLGHQHIRCISLHKPWQLNVLIVQRKSGKTNCCTIQVHFVLRHCFHRKCIIIFSRYEDQVRDNSGIQTSYAYDVEGQKVQVARLDPVYYNKY